MLKKKKIASNEKIREVVEFESKNGTLKTLDVFNIKPGTLARYKTAYNSLFNDGLIESVEQPNGSTIENSKWMKMIAEKFSPKEIEAIAMGGNLTEIDHSKKKIKFSKDRVKIGVMSDTHMGSVYFKENWYMSAIDEMHRQEIDFCCHVGDLVEGMSNRPGQIYELTHFGYDQQKEYAVKMLNLCKFKIYGIDGNHDRWFVKNSGAVMCKDVSKEVENYEFIGHDTAEIDINGIKISMFHGEDGNSYSLSYRLQKLIESFSGGTKPNLLLTGHVHKAVYLPSERNIHAIGAGALSGQSAWMRGKRLANHAGFWIIDFTYNDQGIDSCNTKFYNFYE